MFYELQLMFPTLFVSVSKRKNIRCNDRNKTLYKYPISIAVEFYRRRCERFDIFHAECETVASK